MTQHFIAIREDNQSIRILDSKWEREYGEVITRYNYKWKVVKLGDRTTLGHFIYCFEGHLFSFFDFENGDKNKK